MKSGRAYIGSFQKMCTKKSKNHFIRNFLRNGRLRVKRNRDILVFENLTEISKVDLPVDPRGVRKWAWINFSSILINLNHVIDGLILSMSEWMNY